MVMKIIPQAYFFDFCINMPKDQVLGKLRPKVGERRPLFALGATNVFVGQVYDNGFDIKEDILLNRILNPIFHGSFKKSDGSIIVHVKVSNGLATVSAVWAWIVWFGVLIGMFASLVNKDFETVLWLTIVDAIGAGAIIFIIKFYYYRAKIGEKKLRQLLGK